MRIFDMDSPLMEFLTKIADLMILNLLWLVCSLPIVTIGAATTALYRCLLNLERDGVLSAVRDFFCAFKSNFKKATLLWIIQIAAMAVAALDFLYFLGIVGDMSRILQIICLLPAIWLLMGCSYLFPLQAQFENTVGQTAKNAILLSLANLPTSIAVTALNLVPLLIWYYHVELLLKSLIVWVLIGVSAIAWLNTLLLGKVFQRYIPGDQDEAPPESSGAITTK